MKRTFLRILPLAVAVLLATSCSKDENNDNAVVNNGQETVQTKTLPISITVNQKSLSKLGCTGDMGEALQPIFEAGDKLAIYNGESLLKELAVTADNISNDGKTATFEGEIDAEGLVDGVTELTAKIGTPITAAQTAESREVAVKTGCYQTAEFTYSSEGNTIALEEQNAYIEVVWTNKGGAIVPFTIAGESVNLTLNEQGQGWIVLPAGQSVTCAALGITEANTTVKGNIYGITREYKAVQSVTITGVPTKTIAWGSEFDVTVTISPSDATNQTVNWSATNATVTSKGNGQYHVVITGNSNQKATITASVDGVSSPAADINLYNNYVDLGTGVYWKTTDESGTYTFTNKPSGAPTETEFAKLWDGTVTVSGFTFTNKNGSGASITLTKGWYWSSTTTDGGNYFCRRVYVLSGDKEWYDEAGYEPSRVRLVRAQ
ncbi:MAG: hypothetical protein K5685_13365 [Bacteroidales bacterium]|nr:hypothetical protein [Bacteroidales bacterium]